MGPFKVFCVYTLVILREQHLAHPQEAHWAIQRTLPLYLEDVCFWLGLIYCNVINILHCVRNIGGIESDGK